MVSVVSSAPPFAEASRSSDLGDGIVATAVDRPDPEWDAFLARDRGDVVQTSMWARSKQALGQHAVAIVARENGAIVAGALMTEREVGAGIRIGTIARGPVASGGGRPKILRAALEVARHRRCFALVVQPAPGGADLGTATARTWIDCPIAIAPEATVRLDVRRSDDALLAAMSSARRRNVRKSARQGIAVETSADVALFHRLHVATARRQGFAPLSMDYLRGQWDSLAPFGALQLLIARKDGVPLAGLWLSAFAGTVTFRLAGWDAGSSGSLNVNEALHWDAIRRARSEGAHSYDFGGFDRAAAERVLAGHGVPAGFERTPGFFKLGFGGELILLPRPKLTLLNPIANGLARPILPVLLRVPAARRLARRLRG